MSKVIRSVKNVTKGYSSVQVKVRNATSNDPWGPTGTDMSDIAQMTFNSSNDFYEIMDMLDKRLNDRGKNWRHVLKALKVLDYCLHEGSELVVTWARKNIYIIKTLREFQHVDEDGRDVGHNVRVSAKELTSLVLDEERLRTERSDRKSWKSRVTGIEEFGPSSNSFGSDAPSSRRDPKRRERRTDEEDAEYRLAIEASKYEAEEEQKRRQRTSTIPDDDDLEKAIKLSKEEEELRRKELEQTNESLLFDDTPGPSTQPQFTGYNQGYQQQDAVDWSGNPLGQQQQQQQMQQPQMTGHPGAAYSNPTGFSMQPTGYQNGYGSNGFGGQPSVFDQSQFQPNPLHVQNTAFSNPYSQPANDFGMQNQSMPVAQAQAQAQKGAFPTAGNNNPWANPQQTESLRPAPTGSNNPFASSINRPATKSTSTYPILSTLVEQKTQSQFNNTTFNPATSFAPPPAQAATEMNPQHARLNALLASGEGMDTFGNTGDLRIPSQHTAPGTFVNSAGHGINSQMTGTGNNPFYNQHQFTGGVSQTGLGHLAPAQTGPAFGGGPSPFGGSQGSYNPSGSGQRGQQPQQQQQQQQQQRQTQPGSLIDL